MSEMWQVALTKNSWLLFARQQRGRRIGYDRVRSLGAKPRLYRPVSSAARSFGQALRIGPEVMAIAERAAAWPGVAALRLASETGELFSKPRRARRSNLRLAGNWGWSVPSPDIGARWSWRAQEARSRIASRHRPRSAVSQARRASPDRGPLWGLAKNIGSTQVRLSIQFESLVGRQMTRPSLPKMVVHD
jgi:hypothetical protein